VVREEHREPKREKKRNIRHNWSTHYKALLEYRVIFGHCNVPVRHTFDCYLSGIIAGDRTFHYVGALGKWLCNQQANKLLNPEKEALLQTLVDQGIHL